MTTPFLPVFHDEIIRKILEDIDAENCKDNEVNISKSEIEELSVSTFNRLRTCQTVAKTGASVDDLI